MTPNGPRTEASTHKTPATRSYLQRLFWGCYLRFQGKQWILKLKIISWHTTWCPYVGYMAPTRKGCELGKSGWGWFYGNQVCFSPKEDLVQGKVGHAPRHPKGINTTPRRPKMVTHGHPFIGEPTEITTRRRTLRPGCGAAGVGGRRGLIFIGCIYHIQRYHA
jgi:hypothetical protein